MCSIKYLWREYRILVFHKSTNLLSSIINFNGEYMHLLFSRKVDNLPPCNNYFVDKQEPFLKFSKFAMFIMLYDTTKTKLKVKEDLQ